MKFLILILVFVSNATMAKDSLSIYCDFSSLETSDVFSLVGFIKSEEDDNVSGSFIFDFNQLDDEVTKSLSSKVHESRGYIKDITFKKLKKNSLFKIDFLNEKAEINYIRFFINSDARKPSILELNDGKRLFSLCISE